MTTFTDWFADEEAFARQLARGRRTELAVAAPLLPLGLWMRVGRLQPRHGLANHDDTLTDQADIEIEGGHLLEIKARNFPFTGPDDYPYDTALIGAVRRWTTRPHQPCAVIIISEPTGAAIVIPTNTRPDWTTEDHYDTHRHFTETSYAAPRHTYLHWHRLITHLQHPHPQ
jgi:hypothetical protein